MKKYLIVLHGCEDDTEFEYEMSDEQFEFIKKMSEKSIKSSEKSLYMCMPNIKIYDSYSTDEDGEFDY